MYTVAHPRGVSAVWHQFVSHLENKKNIANVLYKIIALYFPTWIIVDIN